MSGEQDGRESMRTQQRGDRVPRESSVLCWHSSPGCPQGTGLAPPPRGTAVPSPADAAIFRAQLRAGSGRARDRHCLGHAAEPGDSPSHSTRAPCAVTCRGSRAADTGHHKDPTRGVPAPGNRGLGFSHDMQEIFGSEGSSSTDPRTAILSQKSPPALGRG